MKPTDSDEYRRRNDRRVLHTGRALSREEGKQLFREMVRGETRNGPLSPTRRKRLIQYAAALQLTPLEASRVITEVCEENHQPENRDAPPIYRLVETVAAPHCWPTWLKISLVLIAAFAVDRIVRYLL